MTEQVIDNLKKEIAELNNQLKHRDAMIKAAMAQFDASKQMCNEALASSLALRTTVILRDTEINELKNDIANKDKSLASLDQQVKDATLRIAVLEAPAVVEPSSVATESPPVEEAKAA